MKKQLLKIFQKMGYNITKTNDVTSQHLDITSTEFWDIYKMTNPFTRTTIERMYSLYSAVEYVLSNSIAGDFVECGVWRGGSAMLIAQMLKNRGITDRKLFLYDTFEGMSEPTENDIDVRGKQAAVLMEANVDNKKDSVWCLADLDDVQNNMKMTQYSADNIVYVKGKVEDTIPSTVPNDKIALLRLDTDWYESTKHELIHLYPKLISNGVLIIDDYGHWEGCRRACDEYFNANDIKLLLNRIDYTGRLAIKVE